MSKTGYLTDLLSVAGLFVCALSLMGFFGQLGWLWELTSHFRLQYLVFLTLAAGLLGGLGRVSVATLCGIGALINLSQVLPFYFGQAEPAQGQGGPEIRAFLLNVNSGNRAYGRVEQAIRDAKPQVVVLLEVTSRWWAELQSLDSLFPYSVGVPREDNFGIAVFSTLPLVNTDTVYLGAARYPSVVTEIATGSSLVTLFGTHPPAPMHPAQARQRNDHLQAIADFLGTKTTPVLLLGDLNVSPWSYYFKRLITQTGLRDSARGWGIMPTWPVGFWPLRIPIDHCLVSEHIRIRQRQVGSGVGSDHYPLIVDFTVDP